METHTQYFCYVYDAPGRTPQMFPLEADSFTEAVEGATIGREQIANCQEIGIEHPDNAAGS